MIHYKIMQRYGRLLVSLGYPSFLYSIYYEEGKEISGTFPLFIFDTYDNAKKYEFFAKSICKNPVEVWEVSAESVRKIDLICLKDSKIPEFWQKDYARYYQNCPNPSEYIEFISYTGYPVEGTLVCDSLKLIRRVD